MATPARRLSPAIRRRWRRYILDALVETTISRDVLLLYRVDKPARRRRLYALGCEYSGQILSYNKMLGQLQDAGNTTTLAHYLDLLSASGLMVGLQKFAGKSRPPKGLKPKVAGPEHRPCDLRRGIDSR